MKILVTGQLSLHWGRMEYGNIGNYYIIEPFFRQLHEVFPNATICTTFQMTKEFCNREQVEVLPMKLFYSFNGDEVEEALKELSSVIIYSKTKNLPYESPYIQEVLGCDLFIDFSGDMWGDNADIAGKDRFLVGVIKDKIAQILGKPTVMLAESPGPFEKT